MLFEATLPPDQLKRKLHDIVNAKRASLLAEPIAYDGRMYDANRESITNLGDIVTGITAGIGPPEVKWRDAENQDVMLSAAAVVQLAKAVMVRNLAIYEASFDIKSAISTAEDPSSVNLDSWWL